MLFKIFLVLVIMVTVGLVAHSYMTKFMSKSVEVINISDNDFDKTKKNQVNEDGEVLISDSEIDDKKVVYPTTSEPKKGAVETDANSKTKVTYDAHGNKTETKTFFDHERIKMIKVQTNTKGEKRVFVYSQTGMVENVPQNMINSVLSKTPDEVANAAGIYETRAEKEKRKNAKIQARRDRQRKVDMAEFERTRENLPEPVFPDYQQDKDEPEQSNERREQISKNDTPEEE